MLRLQGRSLDWALAHLVAHGDTDVLPTPFEFDAIQYDWDAVREFCSRANMLDWPVRPHRTLLAPKAGYGFRVVTQLDPLDVLVFAALIREIAEDIETRRVPVSSKTVFSYRVQLAHDGQLFNPSVRYDDFRRRTDSLLRRNKALSHVAVADIADFYSRIYHHRLEGGLNASTPKTNHVNAIMKLLSGWNGTETFGIPVGNQPSRLLAETALIDVDEALLAARIVFVRYNDDFRLFAGSHSEAYRHLAFLADILYKNHGLTLQPQKTTVVTRSQFRKRFLSSPEQRELDSLRHRFREFADELGLSDLYEEIEYGQLTIEQKAFVDSLNLNEIFREEAMSPSPDATVVSFILRRLTQLGDASVPDEVLDRLDNLYPLFPQIIMYLRDLRGIEDKEYRRIGGRVLDALDSSIVSELEYHRMWGLDLFTRSTKWHNADRFFRMLGEARDSVSRRKLILGMGRAHHRHWFQSQWRNLFNEAPWPKRALIAAASCLPSDARKHWYKSIAARLDPLETAVMKWAKANPF
jgi:hypothetical protein